MILKGIIDEDFINYRKPSMVLMFPRCDFKCDRECGMQVCQNSALATALDIEVNTDDIIQRYLSNPITQAVVIQGLEPFDTPAQLYLFIDKFREKCDDDIVIYTGYTEEEVGHLLDKTYRNLIVKYGRYVPGQNQHYDEVLGVRLASDNQYGEKVS